MSIEAQAANTMPGHTNSEQEFTIEIILFACGHGDTILLRLPVDKWILIDCCLPKLTFVFDRFLQFLDNRGIRRFEYVFQTHPDFDHFLGMADLLRHFTRDGRSIGY